MNGDLETPCNVSLHKGHSIKILPRQKSVKKKNRNKSDLGENFIAPDGGWGWLIAIAAGINILVSFPIMQQFGILFRQRFKDIGIGSAHITTIINTQQAAATCTGLFNGAIFRRFSYRQVGLFGAVLLSTGLLLTIFADSVMFYFFTISILYGVGRGIIFTASNIAVNTYFKEKRRTATACQYTVAGLGPIVLPYISTFLIAEYGVPWAVLFYAGLSFHNFASSLIYQPVKWHVKKRKDIELDDLEPYNLVFGSKNLAKLNKLETSDGSNDLNQPRLSAYSDLKVPKNSYAAFEPLLNPIPKIILPDETEYIESPQEVQDKPLEKKNEKPTIFQKISIFLDLDLLKDFSFVNLSIGLTILHFIELNFAFLTPFILNDFDCNSSQIAKAMSLLAFCDILMRLSLPICTKNLKWSNKTVLLYAVMGMCIGRTALVYSSNFTMVLLCFGWMGLCKAFRLVFWLLILPSYVPLKRLPAAIGLQRAILGLFTLCFGPFIGIIRDATNYGITLHCMNAMCLFVTFCWLGEDLFKWFQQKRRS